MFCIEMKLLELHPKIIIILLVITKLENKLNLNQFVSALSSKDFTGFYLI